MIEPLSLGLVIVIELQSTFISSYNIKPAHRKHLNETCNLK